MVKPAWKEVPLSQIRQDDEGWMFPDMETQHKLTSSVRRYGQLRAVVVRRVGDMFVVVDGRKVLQALKECGEPNVMVCDLGDVSWKDAMMVALALKMGFVADYAAFAATVSRLLDDGTSDVAIASCSPFSAERVRYFWALMNFDWSRFKAAQKAQHEMDWASPDDIGLQTEL